MKTVAVVYFVEVEDNMPEEDANDYAIECIEHGGRLPDAIRTLSNRSAGVFHSFNFKNEDGDIISE